MSAEDVVMVAGTDAGIVPAKPHDVVRHAPAVLRLLGFGQAEALRGITYVAAAVPGPGKGCAAALREVKARSTFPSACQPSPLVRSHRDD